MNNEYMQLSSVLNIECTKSSVHCTSKKRALEIISELAAKQLNLPSQVVFDAVLTRERMGSTGIGNGIAIPHGKLEEDTLRAVGVFIRLDQPIAFDAIDNQPVDLLFALLVPADQCKNPFAYPVAGRQTPGRQNRMPPPARRAERRRALPNHHRVRPGRRDFQPG